jgi:hypothetical protein
VGDGRNEGRKEGERKDKKEGWRYPPSPSAGISTIEEFLNAGT